MRKCLKTKQLNENKSVLRFILSGSLCLFLMIIFIGNLEAVAKPSLNNSIPKTEVINVTGPGALYIALYDEAIGFWLVDDGKVSLIKSFKIIDKTAPSRILNVILGKKVIGIFYADNLPLGSDLKLKIDGNLENKDCPLCTVSMPLSGNTLSEWLAKEDTSKLINQQNDIFSLVEKLAVNTTKKQDEFIDQQQKILYDYYTQIEKFSADGQTILTKNSDAASAFEKLLTKRQEDKQIIEKTATTYQNFLNAQAGKIGAVKGCVVEERYRGQMTGLEAELQINSYPDPLPANFNEETTPAVNRQQIIEKYENYFAGLEKTIMNDCVLKTQLKDIYTTTADVVFPGST
nr:hypothetical protein [Pyrinomonadaceae bacterium]